MSVLSSTKTGRCSIKVTVGYLIERGWQYKDTSEFSEFVDIDYGNVWKDNKHKLQVVILNQWLTEQTLMIPTFHEEVGRYIYNLPVFSLDQLDDIEEFWRIWDEIGFETAEKFLLSKYPKIKERNLILDLEDNMTKEFSKEIDNTIEQIIKMK